MGPYIRGEGGGGGEGLTVGCIFYHKKRGLHLGVRGGGAYKRQFML